MYCQIVEIDPRRCETDLLWIWSEVRWKYAMLKETSIELLERERELFSAYAKRMNKRNNYGIIRRSIEGLLRKHGRVKWRVKGDKRLEGNR